MTKFKIAIVNGRIVDGTGNPWYKANIGIDDDGKITLITKSKISGELLIDANNCIVSPGFI
ncbi:MAG: aminoacylase, partial [Candidatus Methanomethylicia archaeon]